jgi:integrase
MAKAQSLQTRSSRRAIPGDDPKKLHTVKLFTGLALGYRKGLRDGTWVARRHESGTKYSFEPLGIADDLATADGVRVLTFDQAQEAARQWFKRKAVEDSGEVLSGPYTVAQAVESYIADSERDKRKALKRTRAMAEAHILPLLGSVQLAKLTHGKVKTWRDGLAEAPLRVRSKVMGQPAYRDFDANDPDAVRRRHATANRVFTVFRAAMNHAYRHNRVAGKGAWERVSAFRNTDGPKVRYLTVDECKRLIAVCPPDFRKLVQAALYSGCRYGELRAMQASAFNPDSNSLHIPISKSGKERHVALSAEGAALFAAITANKKPKDLLFTHTDGRQKGTGWLETQQTYWMEKLCKEAEIEPAIGFHILRHTYGSQLAMQSTPITVIAVQLGHADTRMTEKHYAHLSQSYVADMVRANLPSFGFAAPHGLTLVTDSVA